MGTILLPALLGLAVLHGPGRQDGPLGGQDGDLAARALALLESRCAPCHSPDSDEPKARRHWADATDIPGTIEGELLVPGDPDDSEIYLMVDEGEMPPPDSEIPPLTGSERTLLAAWIKAGAPTPGAGSPELPDPSPEGQDPPGDRSPPSESAGDPQERPGRPPALRLLGRAHPIAVHFPIAFLLGAALADLLALVALREALGHARRFCLWLASPAAVVAAFAGWMAAEVHTSSPTLTQHRWMGVGTAALALLALIASEVRSRAGPGSPWTLRSRLLLLLTAVLVGVTAHWGGTITHGPSYLSL